MKKILLVTIAFLITTFSYSEDLYNVLASSGGLSLVSTVGLNRLDCDIQPNYDLTGILKSPSLDVGLEYSLHPVLSVGMDIGIMMFNQEDNNERYTAGNVFTYNYFAVDLLNLVTAVRCKRWNLWARGGIGYGGLLRPDYILAEGHESSLGNSTVKTPDSYIIFPVGLAVEYHINSIISLALTGRYYFTNTDYLETVARHEQNDLWQNLGISVRYKFAYPDRVWSRY